MLTYMLLELVSAVVGAIAVIFILYQLQKRTHFMRFFKHKAVLIPLCLFVIAFFAGLIANRTYPPTFAMPAFMHSHAPGGVPASIPFNKILDFFLYENKFERVADIGADPTAVPSEPQKPDADGVVRIHLDVKEVIAEISPGIYYNYWTYNGQTPGPMLRIREGDTVELTLTNDPSSLQRWSL